VVMKIYMQDIEDVSMQQNKIIIQSKQSIKISRIAACDLIVKPVASQNSEQLF